LIVAFEQCFNFPAQLVVAAASALQISGALIAGQLKRLREDFHVTIWGIAHRIGGFWSYISVIASNRTINTRRDLLLKRLTGMQRFFAPPKSQLPSAGSVF
jgi:hypothetical protein